MYNKLLIPLDGSETAEKVLPYVRYLAGKFNIPMELLAVVDISETASQIAADKARYLDTLVENAVRSNETYLQGVAATFAGAKINCTVAKGRPHDTIIEKANADEKILIAMATHGRSGLNRFLLGSVAEKVLRGSANPLLLVRATNKAKSAGEVELKNVIVPLDGSTVAEGILPIATGVAKNLSLEVLLFRAYHIPYNVYAANEGYYAVNYDDLIAGARDEANQYLAKKVSEVKQLGVQVTSVSAEGIAGDEIIALGRKTPGALIAMCSHGRSGVKRWVLGSVAETVVRHTENPILISRVTA